MRHVRKLTLLVMAAIAAMTLTTPAVAEHEPMLHNQTPRLIAAQEVHAANDLACPAVVPTPPVALAPTVTSGGCRQHYVAPSVVMSSHSVGGVEVVVSTCAWEFDVRIDAAAEGWLSHQELTAPPVGTCTKRPCGQTTPASEGRASSFYMQEAEPAPRESFVIWVCTENLDGTFPGHCGFRLEMSEPTLHRYRFTADDLSELGSLPCELDGVFDVEAVSGTSGEGQTEQQIEVRHT